MSRRMPMAPITRPFGSRRAEAFSVVEMTSPEALRGLRRESRVTPFSTTSRRAAVNSRVSSGLMNLDSDCSTSSSGRNPSSWETASLAWRILPSRSETNTGSGALAMMMSAPSERPDPLSSRSPGPAPGDGMGSRTRVEGDMGSSFGSGAALPPRWGATCKGSAQCTRLGNRDEKRSCPVAGQKCWVRATTAHDLLFLRFVTRLSAPAADLFLDLVDVRGDFVAIHFELDSLPTGVRVGVRFDGEPTSVKSQGGHAHDEKQQDEKQVTHVFLPSKCGDV